MRRAAYASRSVKTARGFLQGIFGQSADAASKGAQGAKEAAFDSKNLMDPQKLMEMMRNMTPEQRVESMKRAIEMQKKLAKLPGVGGLVSKNIGALEKLLEQVQSSSPQAESPIASDKKTQLRATGPSLDELRKVSLGPEIDALFAELASMRAKRNEYRDKFEEADAQNKTLHKSLAEQTTAAADLRDRLRTSEKTVSLLNGEVATLTEKNTQIKSLRSQLQEAQNKVALEQAERGSEAQYKQRLLAAEANVVALTKQNESLTRRIERVQHRDPTLRLSLLVSDVRRAAGEHANFDRINTALTDLQDSFSRAVTADWLSLENQRAAGDIVFAAAQAFIGATLSFAYYDAVIEFKDEHELSAAIDGCNFIVEPLNDGDAFAKYLLRFDGSERPPIGPYGVAFALHDAGMASLTSVRPFVSQILFDNPRRVRLEETYTRSSKPGGQAANVAETQSNVSLYLDDTFIFSAESQDTRKALENRQLAKEKLRDVELPKYNRRIAKERHEIVMADNGPFLWTRDLADLLKSDHPYVRAIVTLLQKHMEKQKGRGVEEN